MKKTEDELIRQFLHANKQEIADNGFSTRVMKRLPQQHWAFAKWATALCWVICICLFVALGGIDTLVGTFCNIAASSSMQQLLTTSLPKLALGAFIISGIIIYQVYTIYEER